MSVPPIPQAIAHATNNRLILEKGEWAACYYCKEVYPPGDITEYVDDGETALCPCCGIDSVLPESAGYPFTPATLKALHAYWFGVDEDESCPLD